MFEKAMRKKIVPGFSIFTSMLFLIFEKAMSKKIAPGILRFVSMFFNLIINVIIFSIKKGYSGVWDLYYYKKGYISIFRFVGILF